MSIKNFTDEQLLLELFSRNEGSVSPRNVTYVSPHSEFIVGIGSNHSVAINIDDEALYELNMGTFNNVNDNLDFGSAIAAMKDGKKVAVPEWKGYWKLDKGKVMAHCEDGQIVDATHFQVNIFRNDWMVVD